MPSAGQGNVITNAAQFVAGVVNAAALGTDAVTTAKIIADAVTAAKIQDNAILDADIGAHTTTKITVPSTLLTVASQVQGDIVYFNGTNWVRLAPGTSGQVLQSGGAAANPSWATGSSILKQMITSHTTVSTTAAAQTTLFSGTVTGANIGANSMIRIHAGGLCTNASTGPLMFVTYGGTTIAEVNFNAAPTADYFWFQCDLFFRNSVSSQISRQFFYRLGAFTAITDRTATVTGSSDQTIAFVAAAANAGQNRQFDYINVQVFT